MRRLRWLIAATLAFASVVPASAQDAQPAQEPDVFAIGVLRHLPEPPAWQTAFTKPPEDEGIAGARLGIQDNSTTGSFMNQEFTLAEEIVPTEEDPMAAFQRLVDGGAKYIVVDVAADALLAMADAAPDDVILFNAGAQDNRLRNDDCRANIFHTAPSRSMLTDALAQYLVSKRWLDWFLIVGTRDGDKLYAEAIKASAEKFGANIVEEKVWDFGPDMRRQAQEEVPVFTQDIDYDLAIVADELGEFGDLLLYRTWEPKLVAGTQGLSPLSWHAAIEAWGAVQFQNRFIKLNGRRMGALDYQFWAAVRAVGEAATVVQTDEVAAIRDLISSQEFEMAGFKGVPLNFRGWDQQLRQPIPLVQPVSLVATSPQEGFLHQRTTLDTLGTDEPETTCQLGN